MYKHPIQIAGSENSKKLGLSPSDKGREDTFGFRYVLKDGRMLRKKVGKDEKNFLTDGKNSFTSVNKAKIRIGTRPQQYKKAPEPASTFFNYNRSLFESNEVDLDKAVVVSGCFDTNRVTLQRTAIPECDEWDATSIPTKESIAPLKKAIKATVRKMRIEILNSPRFDDVLNCKFNENTKPGFTADNVLRKRRKKDAISDSIVAANRIWYNIESIANKAKKKLRKDDSLESVELIVNAFIENPPPGTNIYDVGARGKRDVTYEDGEFASSRAVHMPEFHNEIVMAPWIDSITSLIKSTRRGPIYIGNSIADYVRYEKDLQKGKSFLEGDWKRFDSTLYCRVCMIAISIMRLYYPENDVRADAFFVFMMERLVVKDYYFPGGRIVRMIHGLPSGTKCTSLLGSIINLLCLNYCIEKFNPKNFFFAVGGDDFVVICSKSITNFDIERIIERSTSLGMVFKFLKEKFLDAENLRDMPYFYKYTVRNGLPYVNTSDILERVFIPWNKNYGSSLKYLNFLEDQFPQLGYPNASLLPFYSIYVNVFRRVHKKTKITVGSVYAMHFKLFEKYTSKLYFKSLSDKKDEIFTFLKNTDYSKLNMNSKVLLGYLPKSKTYSIFFLVNNKIIP